MPTVPREPSTLRHSVESVLRGLAEAHDTKFYLVKNASEHPEADSVAEEFGLTVWDGTRPHLDGEADLSWERKLTLDMARALQWAAQTGADQILYLEDDIEAASHLSRCLYSRTWMTILFSGLCGINNWHHPNTCGTVALLFPNDQALSGLVEYFRERSLEGPADKLLACYIQENNLTQSQRVPNPVQHKGLYSSRNGERFDLISPTYREGAKVPPPVSVLWAIRYFATRLKIWLEKRAQP